MNDISTQDFIQSQIDLMVAQRRAALAYAAALNKCIDEFQVLKMRLEDLQKDEK